MLMVTNLQDLLGLWAIAMSIVTGGEIDVEVKAPLAGTTDDWSSMVAFIASPPD